MPADRLRLDTDTILQAIPDEARQEHARTVLSEVAEELQEHEAREPIASLLVTTLRMLERVEVRLADGSGLDGLFSRITETVPLRVIVTILVALVAAIGALLGLDVSGINSDEIVEAAEELTEDLVEDEEGGSDGGEAP